MIFFRKIWAAALFLCIPVLGLTAQPSLQTNYSYSMDIPAVIALESSEAHLYVLSQSEGMAVFRTRADSLQWLYTAAGMQQRGNTIHADIRFAYLFGNSRRLTVLEPTSVMGAFSSTNLASQPLDAERLDENLYVVLGSGAFGKLSLDTPEALDSAIEKIEPAALAGKNIIDIESSAGQLFLLSDEAGLFMFTTQANDIKLSNTMQLKENISRIFFVNGILMGTNNDGDIFEISGDGRLSKLGGTGEPVIDVKTWGNWLIIKGSTNRLWTSYQLREPTLWKQNGAAGNYAAVSKGQLWICEYNRISRIKEVREQTEQENSTPATTSGKIEIAPVGDQVIPYPHTLLIPLTLKSDFPVKEVQFSLQADVQDAIIRGQSLYWQPESGDVGQHRFKVIASTGSGESSATDFTVDVRSFNAPPRFTPLRTISIPVGQPFDLPIKAMDPDGMNKDLIRYLGVNLPAGSTLNEQKGDFSWTPTERQIGENTFRVIATDQYGAASSVNVKIRVIETNSRGN